LSIPRQNRTKVGLKLVNFSGGKDSTVLAKSNQGGIETLLLLHELRERKRQNRTKVGLKPVRYIVKYVTKASGKIEPRWD